MTSLICGSLAFDTIMSFHGKFSEALLADQLHKINVAFLVPGIRREYGGCAGNIAYNLKLLGGDPLIMATVGTDATPYCYRMDKLGLSRECVREVPDTLTAQAFITTDLDDNQITAFHPGAMNHSDQNRITEKLGAKLAIVAPDGRAGMIQHARELASLGIPFIFDPGQGLPMFSGDELLEFIDKATYVAVNDYEGKMLEAKTGQSLTALAGRVDALIATRGAEGSIIYTKGQRLDIPCVKATSIVDPTGCGDAYRAGLLYGIGKGLDWRTTGQIAALMGSLKIASRGGQNHHIDRAGIQSEYQRHFGSTFA